MRNAVHIGAFALGELIGKGGMGAIYGGTHRETGFPVAIKVIDGPIDPEARRLFQREVQAHAGLLHPNIVHLFEYGHVGPDSAAATDDTLREGSPYVVMERADRGTVRDHMPVDNWEQARLILLQTLDALAHAHARGVVHRDLKPENLLCLRQPDAPGEWRLKLADFGLAHAVNRTRDADHRKSSSPAGTPRYMSPEQFRAAWRRYGPWTDLYAVGCIAWELVCGAPPFDHESNQALALNHLGKPRPPLEPAFPVPDGLEDWIQRAMAIEPNRRFRRAADALWALPDWRRDRVSGTEDRTGDPRLVADGEPDGGAETVVEPQLETVPLDAIHAATPRDTADDDAESTAPLTDFADESPPIPLDWRPDQAEPAPAPLLGAGLGLFGLREPPFVDRRHEGDQIWEALHRVVDQQSAEVMLLEGAAGTGKSRLAESMMRRAHEVGAARTLRGFHRPDRHTGDGLRMAFELALRTSDMGRRQLHEHLGDTLPPLPGESTERYQRDRRALTEYLRPTDEGTETVDGPRYRFSRTRQRRALVVRTLRRFARRRPVVIWLDDLHWGGETIAILEHLRDDARESFPMLALATVRPDSVADDTRVADGLDRLRRAEDTSQLTIRPLPKSHQRELLSGLFPLEAGLADRLVERTEGHPLFAMQLLGHWIDRDALRVGDDGFEVPADTDPDLPDGIRDLWMERVERVVETFPAPRVGEVLRALEMAAALGREVDRTEWTAMLRDADLDAPLALVARLVDRGLADPTDAGWAFSHGLLVDALAQRAREAGRWRDHHRRCARTLEQVASPQTLGPRRRLAHHWIEAGRPERALDPLLDEVELARDRSKDDLAREMLVQRSDLLDTLEVAEDHRHRIEQQVECAIDQKFKGSLDRAKQILAEAWQTLDGMEAHAELQARVADQLGSVEAKRGHDDRGETWCRRALEAAGRAEIPKLRGTVHQRLGWQAFARANYDQAHDHTRLAVQLAQRADDRYGKLEALRLRAVIWKEQRDPRAEQLFDHLFEKTREFGYPLLRAQAINGLGDIAFREQRLDDARRRFDQYLAQSRELSFPLSQIVAHLNLANVEVEAGNLEPARRHLREIEQFRTAMNAEDHWEGQIRVVQLALAATANRESDFRDQWRRFDDGWDPHWRVGYGHARLLEIAGQRALDAGWQQIGREALQLARTLWEDLDRSDCLDRLDEQMST